MLMLIITKMRPKLPCFSQCKLQSNLIKMKMISQINMKKVVR